MRKLVLTTVLVLCVVAVYGAGVKLNVEETGLPESTSPPVPVVMQQCAPEYRLVGVTEQTMDGNAGILVMARACSSEFSRSRVCTSAEILKTSVVPELPEVFEAWVLPVVVDRFYGGPAYDVSGAGSSSSLSCGGWSVPSGTGLLLDSDGELRVHNCNVQRSVACCSPAPGQ